MPAAETFDADQFAQSGPAADMAPGPMLGTIMDLAVGPAEMDGFGLVDNDDTRDLLAAARHPRTRWCLTYLNPRGAGKADEAITH